MKPQERRGRRSQQRLRSSDWDPGGAEHRGVNVSLLVPLAANSGRSGIQPRLHVVSLRRADGADGESGGGGWRRKLAGVGGLDVHTHFWVAGHARGAARVTRKSGVRRSRECGGRWSVSGGNMEGMCAQRLCTPLLPVGVGGNRLLRAGVQFL